MGPLLLLLLGLIILEYYQSERVRQGKNIKRDLWSSVSDINGWRYVFLFVSRFNVRNMLRMMDV